MRYPKITNPFYRTKAWKMARIEALTRDNHLCQRCFEKQILTKADTVHHIHPIDTHPNLALELSNLQSLCAACHNSEHGRRNPKPEPKCRARVIKG